MRSAGIDRRTYQRALAGDHAVRPSTLVRLERALNCHAATRRPRSVIKACHRAAMAECARALGLDPLDVLATDFTKQTSVNQQWLAAARVRRLAMYVVVTELDVTQAALAAAIGITKQGVGKALRDIEDLRDEQARYDRVIQDVALLLAGWR